MKKTAVFLLCLLMLGAGSLTAFADEEPNITPGQQATIETEVPSTHNVTVKLTGEGSYTLGGKSGTTIAVDRLSEPTLDITPAENYALKTVKIDGKDVTSEVKDGKITLEPVYKDVAIEIETEKLPEPDESKPDESKPDESKPDESKPDESKPDESKPDESKPDESKPDESKPDESEPEPSYPTFVANGRPDKKRNIRTVPESWTTGQFPFEQPAYVSDSQSANPQNQTAAGGTSGGTSAGGVTDNTNPDTGGIIGGVTAGAALAVSAICIAVTRRRKKDE